MHSQISSTRDFLLHKRKRLFCHACLRSSTTPKATNLSLRFDLAEVSHDDVSPHTTDALYGTAPHTARLSRRLSADEFNRFLNKRVYQLLATFDELDVEKTGRISAKDVREGLRRAGVPHMDADVTRALRRMGKAQDGSGGFEQSTKGAWGHSQSSTGTAPMRGSSSHTTSALPVPVGQISILFAALYSKACIK